ncbi:glycosyltransferase family 4 protein [Candidatus Saccharibacteria bacterium]|nr:MAG: glycosyltransferase family 4 protein [Candidatus Saccharibacteria bacterium]
MKIGLVCPYNITRGGGVQEVVKALQLEFTKLGHEAVVITPQPKEPYASRDHRVIFLGTATDFKSPLATTTQVSASVLTDEIDNMLEYEKFDVLHFHEPWVPVLSRQILSRSTCVNVGTVHAKLPETIASRALMRVVTPYTKPLIRYIDAFTAVSEAAAEYLRTLTDDPIEIIPNGIHTGHFRSPAHLADLPKAKTILYIGRIEKRKGVKYLLRAFQILQERQPDARLIIAGDGVDREKMQELAEELQLQNVEFLGFIDDHTKLQLLHSADLFCSPAIYGESFGIVLLEAMASGLVTVAGNNPGYESVMTGLGQLSLVDPRDSKEFAHRMELLLTDEGIRQLWKKWAKKHIRQFEYHKVAAMYLSAYEAAIKAASEKPRRKREDWFRT